MEKFIMAGDCALRIKDSGTPYQSKKSDSLEESSTTPVVLLLHGYLESSDIWEEFTDLLKGQVRVVALDLPGHGISEVKGEVHSMEFLADTAQAAMKHIGIGKFTVVGHSMGGYVALEMLRKHPDSLDGVVLFHSTPNPDSEEKKALRQREIEIVLSDKKDLLAATVSNSFSAANRKRFAAEIEDLKELVYMTEDDGIVALLRGMSARNDNNQTMIDSSIPQLFIFGRGDDYITQEIASALAERHPQAQVAWLENSGHQGFIEQPQESADILLRFIADTALKAAQ